MGYVSMHMCNVCVHVCVHACIYTCMRVCRECSYVCMSVMYACTHGPSIVSFRLYCKWVRNPGRRCSAARWATCHVCGWESVWLRVCVGSYG